MEGLAAEKKQKVLALIERYIKKKAGGQVNQPHGPIFPIKQFNVNNP